LFVTNYFNVNNYLYINNGNGTFTKDTSSVVSNDGGSSTGSTFGDIDNDGDLDLFVANDNNENNCLYLNNGFGVFTKVMTGIVVSDAGRSNGSAFADYDLDGDLDLLVTNGNQPIVQNNYLYKNNNSQNNFTSVRCRSLSNNKSSIGTRVTLVTTINGNRISQTREIFGQTGYNAQNQLPVHFGTGNSSSIDSLIIEWHSSLPAKQIFTNLDVNKFYTIQQGQNITSVSNENEYIHKEFILNQNYPNPFNPETKISFNLSKGGKINLQVFDISGREIMKVAEDFITAGYYTYIINLDKYPSGIYFYRLITEDNYADTKKMILIK